MAKNKTITISGIKFKEKDIINVTIKKDGREIYIGEKKSPKKGSKETNKTIGFR